MPAPSRTRVATCAWSRTWLSRDAGLARAAGRPAGDRSRPESWFPAENEEQVLARFQQTPTAATDETRERADPEGRLLPPRDDAAAGYAKDLVSFGRGNRDPPNRAPELRGKRAPGRRAICWVRANAAYPLGRGRLVTSNVPIHCHASCPSADIRAAGSTWSGRRRRRVPHGQADWHRFPPTPLSTGRWVFPSPAGSDAYQRPRSPPRARRRAPRPAPHVAGSWRVGLPPSPPPQDLTMRRAAIPALRPGA